MFSDLEVMPGACRFGLLRRVPWVFGRPKIIGVQGGDANAEVKAHCTECFLDAGAADTTWDC